MGKSPAFVVAWMVLLPSLVCLAESARAGEDLHRFNGAYLHAGGAASADRIERVIDYAISHMGALKRSIAGKRLREKNHEAPNANDRSGVAKESASSSMKCAN